MYVLFPDFELHVPIHEGLLSISSSSKWEYEIS
jgi:hypothetical protein